MRWKFILVLFFSISLVSSFSSVDQWHSLLEIATESGYLVDQNSNGIIDAGNSLTAPSSSNNVDTSLPYHPISEVGISQGNLIDLNGNGWPDVCQSLTPPSLTIRPTLEYETLSQISFSNSDLRSIDSNKDGWPDKCDCILSLTGTDNNNCGSCGNVCPGGGTCVGGSCECASNMGQACGSVCNRGTINCAGECSGQVMSPDGTACATSQFTKAYTGEIYTGVSSLCESGVCTPCPSGPFYGASCSQCPFGTIWNNFCQYTTSGCNICKTNKDGCELPIYYSEYSDHGSFCVWGAIFPYGCDGSRTIRWRISTDYSSGPLNPC